MKYMNLGQDGPEVSKIAFGCMSLDSDGDQPDVERRGIEAVHRAFELGITFYDTADVYGRGVSEEILGRALKSGRIDREKVVISSKCSIVFPGMEPAYTHKAYDASPEYVRRSCEASLRRLDVEYLDVYIIHRIDYLTHPRDTAQVLEDLQREGKIRYAAVSNYTADEIRALSEYTRLVALQTQFSLLALEPLETGLMATCLQKGMSVMAWGPLARGVLTGKVALSRSDWQAQRAQGIVAQLAPFAEKYGVTPGQLALAWLVQQPAGVVPLVGTANADHIAEAVAAADVELVRDDWYEMLVTARGRPMPWSQQPYFYVKES